MSKAYFLIPGLISLCLLTGCELNETNNPATDIEYVHYGTSFGECLGYCIKDIHITNSMIIFHKQGWDLEGSLPEYTHTEEIDSTYWTELVSEINIDPFLKLDSIIGCPDCADGGAEWIEIKSKKKSHKVVFEYGSEPEEMKAYIGYLRAYMHAFLTDSNESPDFNTRVLINRQGTVRNYEATRGSEQWLIGTMTGEDTTYYFDTNLDNDYRINDLKIEFNGVLEYDSTTVFMPGPDDVPVPDFKVRNIKIFGINSLAN